MNARSNTPQREIGYSRAHHLLASGSCEDKPMLNPIVQETVTRTPRRRRKVAPLQWRGPQLVAEGNWTEALSVALTLLSRCPDHLGALEVKVTAQLHLGQFEPALLTIRKLIRINASESGYELLRASAMQSMGRLEEALLALDRAETLCRDSRTLANIDSDMQMLSACLGVSPADRIVNDAAGGKVFSIPLVH